MESRKFFFNESSTAGEFPLHCHLYSYLRDRRKDAPGVKRNYQSGCPFWFCSLRTISGGWRIDLFHSCRRAGRNAALRLAALGAVILIALQNTAFAGRVLRMKIIASRADELSILSTVDSDGAVGVAGTGPLAVARCFHPAAVVLVRTGCAWALGRARGADMSHVDLTGAALAPRRAGATLGCHSYRPAAGALEHGRPRYWKLADCRHHFSPIVWRGPGLATRWRVVASGLVLMLRLIRWKWWRRACQPAPSGALMSMEPALAAVSGMIFLGERLRALQRMRPCAPCCANGFLP